MITLEEYTLSRTCKTQNFHFDLHGHHKVPGVDTRHVITKFQEFIKVTKESRETLGIFEGHHHRNL